MIVIFVWESLEVVFELAAKEALALYPLALRLKSAAISLAVVCEDELNSKTAASSAVRRIERMYPEPHAWKNPMRSPRWIKANASGISVAVFSSMLE